MTKDIEKILHGCFHPKKGRSNLHKIPVNIERAGQHIDKARRNLRAMKIMFDKETLIPLNSYLISGNE